MYSILNTLVLFKCWLVPSVINLIFEQNIIYFIETLNLISISIESTDVVSCHCYDSIQKIGKNWQAESIFPSTVWQVVYIIYLVYIQVQVILIPLYLFILVSKYRHQNTDITICLCIKIL